MGIEFELSLTSYNDYICILVGISIIILIQIILTICETYAYQNKEKFQENSDNDSTTKHIIRDLIVLSEKEQKEMIKPKKIHCEDLCPAIVKYPYRICIFIIGFATFFIIFLPLYLLFQLFAAMYSLLVCCKLTNNTKIIRDREYEPIPKKTKMNVLCCDFMRRFMGICRIYLTLRKFKSNSIPSIFVAFYQLVEYFSYAVAPWEYVNLLSNEFGDYFPFIFGIGVAKRDDVIKFLHDSDIRKKASFVFPASTSTTKFSEYAMPYLSSNDSKCKLGREIVHQWLRGFDFTLLKNDTLFNNACPPKPFTTTTFSEDIHSKYIANCFGCIFYYLATEHKLNGDDIKSFESLVFNPIAFLPSWVEFFLGGYYFERQIAKIYERFSDLFALHWKSKAFQSVLKLYKAKQSKGNKNNNIMNLSETARLLSFTFCVAGSIAPSKMCITILKRLYSDPNKYVPLWDKSAENFIRETGRLSKSVPLIAIRSKTDLAVNINGENVILPVDSPLLLSLVQANRDPNVFVNPNEFDCTRDNLGEVVTWNGLEKLISANTGKPPRYCPGHKLVFKLVEYIVNQLKPVSKTQINNNNNITDLDNKHSDLDNYTKTIMKF